MSSKPEPMPVGYDRLVELYLIELMDAGPIQGRHLFGDILEEDYKHADQWAWVKDFIQCSGVEAKQLCIEEEIRRNPGNKIAKKALALINRKTNPPAGQQ